MMGVIGTVMSTGLGLSSATAAPSCRLSDDRDPLVVSQLALGKARGLAQFRLPIVCDAGAKGTWSVAFEQRDAAGQRDLRPIDDRRKPRPLPDSRRSYRMALSSKTLFCDKKVPGGAFRPAGPPGQQFTSYTSRVAALFRGTGALERLSKTYIADVACPACIHTRGRGSIYVRISNRPAERSPHLEVRLAPEWLGCVRATSTLQLRLFAGDDRASALNALQPYATITGLEDKISTKSRDRATRIQLDRATICRRGNGWVAYELWGKGDLHRAGGGGRGAVKIDCP
ncbi:MAG: hypothetical protein AAFV29_16025 [Myxococcota bacterium]